MSTSGERSLNNFYDFCEPHQGLTDVPVFRELFNIVAGSSSPSFVKVEWLRLVDVADLKNNYVSLPLASPDPDAGGLGEWIPRLKKRSAILSASLDEMAEINQWLAKTIDPNNFSPAVVFSMGGIARAGILPNGESDLNYDHSEGLVRVGIREGQKASPVGMGYVIEPFRRFIAPTSVSVEHKHVPLSELGEIRTA